MGERCVIGDDVFIGDYATVSDCAVFGTNVDVGSFAVIGKYFSAGVDSESVDFPK